MASRFKRSAVSPDVKDESDVEQEILYEFITYAEWPQEPELMVKGLTGNLVDPSSARNIPPARALGLWSIFSSASSYVPSDVSQHINNRDAWQFAVGGNGKVIAILEDHSIEIRSSKDEYSSVIGKCSISRDPYPQWRKLAWSPCCSLLAVSYSNGAVDFVDVLGSKLFSIESESLSNKDLGDAIVSILFIDTRVKKTKWSYEVVIINYKGELQSYFLSSSDGYKFYHAFNFEKFYNRGITTALYHPSFNMLLCSGQPGHCFVTNRPSTESASGCGITAWRLQSDFPHFKLSLSLEDEELKAKCSSNFFQRISGLASPKKENYDAVVKLSLSPDGLLMAAIHASGALSFWDIPSLRHRKNFPLLSQPSFDAKRNSSLEFPAIKSKNIPFDHGKLQSYLTDVNWWSEKAVIIGRYSGSLSVASFKTLNNLLGSSVEWFESPPQISESFDRGFLVMECEHRVSSKRRSVSPDPNGEIALDDPEESSEDEESVTFVRKSGKFAKTLLYYVTDNERFQPTRRKSKVLTKTYRLMCLKSTTPEELFARKLDSEEYGEALELARSYGLDCDLVFRRQWKNAPVTVTSIQDYLSKISRRAWVLHECLERAPESLEAARALLQYGLQGTNLQVLLDIQDGKDEGKFVSVNSLLEPLDDSLEIYSSASKEEKKATPKDKNKTLLEKIKFDNLNLEQKYLCQTRHKFLKYLDRLATYEVMLGGPMFADEHFDHNFFKTFRSKSSLEATVEFARQSNWQYVAAMFTYHGKETLPYRLAILSNFPEVLSPFDYRSLLPEIGTSGNKQAVYIWVQENVRDEDWVETKICMKAADIGHESETNSEARDKYSELSSCRETKLTPQILGTWYKERASEIERSSRLVSHALELITLGMERNVKGLERVYNGLLTMEVLVYECFIDDVITFDHLQEMDHMAQLNLIMSVSSTEDFVKNVKKWLMPFLDRLEKQKAGSQRTLLRSYMLALATHDLSLCVKIFENSRTECQSPFIGSVPETIQLALDCIYANQSSDQLNNAAAILECLPQRGYGEHNKKMDELHDRLDVLEKHLGAAEILEKHGVAKPIAFIKDIQRNPDEVQKLITLLTRVSSRKNTATEKSKWRELLEDVMELQHDVFHCIDVNTCAEIFAESLLCAGNKESINLAGELFPNVRRDDSGDSRSSNLLSVVLQFQEGISEERAVQLVISAAREYFNSASNYNDSDIDLAKHCLKLLGISDDSLQAELDLIDSLPILSELGLTILPSQVRLCENRLELIEQVFQCNARAYTYSQKLMKLAHLLRVGQDVHHWEENVYILVSSAAFQAKDYEACLDACQNLIHRKSSNGWKICYQMGQCDEFSDVRARYDLLAFAAVHCSDDKIEDIIKIRNRLDIRRIQHRLQTDFQVNPFSDVAEETKEVRGISILDLNPIHQTRKLASHLRQLTSDTTKNVLSAVGEKVDLLKFTVSWAIPTTSSLNLQAGGFVEENQDLGHVAVPAFYNSLFEECVESRMSPSYTSYAVPQVFDSALTVHLLMLRLTLLVRANDPDAKQNLSPDVLRDIALRLLPMDAMLGVAYLLMLDDPAKIDECFKQFSCSDTSLRLAMYCLALHICNRTGPSKKGELYPLPVDDVIRRGLRHVPCKLVDQPEGKILNQYSKLLRKYEQKRQDFVQARLLQSIDKGVDVLRFSNDDQYKRDTVIGLIMTVDDRIYNIAISLARRYNIPLWDVYISHVTFLFAEQDLKAAAIEKRINDLGILTHLLSDQKRLAESLKNDVYVTISGKSHPHLDYYFTLLEKCNPKSKEIQSHLRLLRKLTNIAKDLDYKRLVGENQDVLIVLSPILTSNNVSAISKLTTQLSTCCKQQISASNLHVTWILKYFYEDIDSEDGTPMTHQKWLARYNFCSEYFDKLEPDDLVKFADGILFVEKSLIYLLSATRKELISRILIHAKAKGSKCKDSKGQGWSDCLQHLEMSAEHLQWMQSEHIAELLQSNDSTLRHYLHEMDLSQSRPDRIKRMLLHCVLSGHPITRLVQLIGICPPTVAVLPDEIVIKALSELKNSLSGNEPQDTGNLLASKDVSQVLKDVGKNLLDHLEQGGTLVNPNRVVKELKSVFTDANVRVPVKLKMLPLLEQMYPYSSEDAGTLALYQAQVILGSHWPDLQIGETDVETDCSRETLVLKMLDACSSVSNYEIIKNLLLHWPPLPSLLTSDPTENTWVKMINSVLESTDESKFEFIVDIIRAVVVKYPLNVQCIKPILLTFLEDADTLHSLKIAILSHNSELFNIVLERLATNKNVNEHSLVDDEICLLLLEQKLVHRTVGTVLFKPVQEYVIQNVTFEDTKRIAAQLKSNNHLLEAASLLIASSSVPKNLRTLDSAVFFLKHLHI